ncbi:MAG TPA: hypothetical protein EYQ00_01865, partial [Dehalococcoidia bacterium]|nr:hypothetical protein [Dehalococcoidia bacterium]
MNIEILQLLLALAAAIIAFGSGVWENSRPTRAFWVTLVAFMSFTCGGFNQLQQSVEVNPLQEFARDEVRKEIVAITTSYEVVDLLSMQDATQDIKFIASLHSRIKNGKAKLSTAA